LKTLNKPFFTLQSTKITIRKKQLNVILVENFNIFVQNKIRFKKQYLKKILWENGQKTF